MYLEVQFSYIINCWGLSIYFDLWLFYDFSKNSFFYKDGYKALKNRVGPIRTVIAMDSCWTTYITVADNMMHSEDRWVSITLYCTVVNTYLRSVSTIRSPYVMNYTLHVRINADTRSFNWLDLPIFPRQPSRQRSEVGAKSFLSNCRVISTHGESVFSEEQRGIPRSRRLKS